MRLRGAYGSLRSYEVKKSLWLVKRLREERRGFALLRGA
jgi:hypothetical protein